MNTPIELKRRDLVIARIAQNVLMVVVKREEWYQYFENVCLVIMRNVLLKIVTVIVVVSVITGMSGSVLRIVCFAMDSRDQTFI